MFEAGFIFPVEAFAFADPALGPILDDWVKLEPTSYPAHQARAKYRDHVEAMLRLAGDHDAAHEANSILALETSGAIRGYRALIDDRLLGKRMTVFIRITLERQSAPVLAAFEAAVRRSNAIVSCHLMAGQYDYMLVVRVADMDDYGRLHQNEFSRLPGVTRLETSFALRDVLEV